MTDRYIHHPWHGVDIGANAPDIVTTYIEITPSDTVKYEIDKASGWLKVDRPQKFSNIVPALYGFIPQTYGGDKDPLDILVISSISVQPLCIVKAKVIGVMQMIDSGDADDKIIAVSADDKSVSHIDNIEEMPKHFFDELRQFFEEYKKLENKTVKVEEFQNKAMAISIVEEAIASYQKHFATY